MLNLASNPRRTLVAMILCRFRVCTRFTFATVQRTLRNEQPESKLKLKRIQCKLFLIRTNYSITRECTPGSLHKLATFFRKTDRWIMSGVIPIDRLIELQFSVYNA